MPEHHADAAAVPVPDAGDDVLREQLIDVLVMSPLSDTAGTELAPVYRTADALLPRIRAHVAAAVQAQREWADEATRLTEDATKRAETAEAEVERLHSWGGLLELLDEHWPADIFPMPEGLDDAKNRTRRDTGPIILGLIRWVDKLSAETMRYRKRAERMVALADVSDWHVYESRDAGDVYPAQSVQDLMADIRAALDGTEATP